MKKQLLQVGLMIGLFLSVQFSYAQLRTPAPSPSSKLMQTVGLTDITVEYSRPSVKGRTIFGDKSTGALEPNGVIWRTGANAATKVSFSKDLKVGGNDLKAGDYALLTKLGAGEWEFMFFPYESGNWGSYTEKEPATKVSVKTAKTSALVETFTIQVGNITANGATLDLMWENVMASIPVMVHTEKEVMAAFDKMKAGPSNAEYYNMGSYLLAEGKDLETALSYIQKATHNGEPRYWQLRTEALAYAKLKKFDKAVEVAKKSMAAAKEAGNDGYVRMNEKSITKWAKM